MPIKLNHTIVHSKDPKAAAAFFSDIFGLPPAVPFGPFLGIEVANEITLDFLDAEGDPETQHYAFLVSDDDFEQIFGRIKERGVRYWADPHRSEEGRINHYFGGRGFYFEDPSGHLLEVMTRPYGREFPEG